MPDVFVTTLAGSGVNAISGSTDGYGRSATFSTSMGQIVVDAGGNLWIADAGSNSIRILAPGSLVTTFAGSLRNLRGYQDGLLANALFSSPSGVVVNGSGVAYGSAPYVAYVAGALRQ